MGKTKEKLKKPATLKNQGNKHRDKTEKSSTWDAELQNNVKGKGPTKEHLSWGQPKKSRAPGQAVGGQ